MKNCSTSLAIRKCKLKPQWDNYFTRPRLAKIEKYYSTKCLQLFNAEVLYTSLFIKAKKWNDPNIYQLMNRWVKLVYPYNGILVSNKKEWSSDTYYNTDEPWKHAKLMKPDTKTTYCMIPFIWDVHSRQIHRDRK